MQKRRLPGKKYCKNSLSPPTYTDSVHTHIIVHSLGKVNSVLNHFKHSSLGLLQSDLRHPAVVVKKEPLKLKVDPSKYVYLKKV